LHKSIGIRWKNVLVNRYFLENQGVEKEVKSKIKLALVEQELLTLPEHLSSPQFLMGFVLLDL
jgi:hypothetical protein